MGELLLPIGRWGARAAFGVASGGLFCLLVYLCLCIQLNNGARTLAAKSAEGTSLFLLQQTTILPLQ